MTFLVLESLSHTFSEEQPKIAANLPFVASLAADLELNLVVIDVGCRWGFADVWSLFGSNVTLIGFDPDASECEHLQNTYQGSGNIHYGYSLILELRRGQEVAPIAFPDFAVSVDAILPAINSLN